MNIPDYLNGEFEYKNNENVYLYIFKKESSINETFYKIGISNNPKLRLKSLNNHPKPINLISYYQYKNRGDAQRIEGLIHQFLSEKRARLEWFILTDVELILLDSMIRTFTNCVYQHIEPWQFNLKY